MSVRPPTPQWHSQWDDEVPEDAKPNPMFVLALLILAAFTLSYLGSYAISGALVKAELLSPWTVGRDPRPIWLATGFFVLLGVFTSGLLVARHVSRQSIRELERAEKEVLAD